MMATIRAMQRTIDRQNMDASRAVTSAKHAKASFSNFGLIYTHLIEMSQPTCMIDNLCQH